MVSRKTNGSMAPPVARAAAHCGIARAASASWPHRTRGLPIDRGARCHHDPCAAAEQSAETGASWPTMPLVSGLSALCEDSDARCAPSRVSSVALDQIVVPVDRQRLVFLVDQRLEEGVEVLGVEAEALAAIGRAR